MRNSGKDDDRSAAPASKGRRAPDFFVNLLGGRQDPVELEFMSEVDAALRYRGSKWAYVLSFLILLFFIGFLLWISFTERNEVTRGEGQITPSLGVQLIQSEQGGIVKEIFVKEGQEVRAEDKLGQMSNIEALAEYQNLLNRQMECTLSLKRFDAERSGGSLEFTDEERTAYPDMVEDQMRLFTTRREKLESGARELKATLEQKRLAVQEALDRKQTAEQNLILLKEQAERVRPLVAQNRYPKLDYLNLLQRVIGQEGELNTLVETIARTQNEMTEEAERLANRDQEWQTSVATERNDYRRQLDAINQRLSAGSHRVETSYLRAPMNGVIRRILLKEESVAQRAQTIMELLPTDDTLEVDARFRPADRGFLEEGMEAIIKVDAYDFTIYGGLPAQIVRISGDTIEDNKGQAWYEVRLKTGAAKLMYSGQELEMKPGMTVKVDVLSGQKSIFDYLMKPILKSRQTGKARGGHADPAEEAGGGAPPAPENAPAPSPEGRESSEAPAGRPAARQADATGTKA